MLNIFLYHHFPAFNPRIDYVLCYIESHPLVAGQITFIREASEADISINYGGEEKKTDYYIPAQRLFLSEAPPKAKALKSGRYTSENLDIYSVESNPSNGSAFLQNKTFSFDLIETVFFHISRYEEWFYKEDNLDAFGRMDEKAQFLVKNGLEKIPVMDHLILAFLRALGISAASEKTSFVLTHDIDFIQRNNHFPGIIKSILGAVLKRGDFRTALRIWQQRRQPNPYDTFDWMLSTDDRLEKKIYFLVGGNSRFDNPYDLELPEFKKAIKLCKERGYQIGIHPSFESWKSVIMISEEKEKLGLAIESKVQITRQHFLRFSFPETASILEKLGFKEDASMGYAERIGFRCGTGFPYKLYNFEGEKAYSFLELPLIFMDSALFYESGHDPQKFEALWRDFLLRNKEHTQITFNFHNSRFFDAFLYDLPLKRLYKELFAIEDI